MKKGNKSSGLVTLFRACVENEINSEVLMMPLEIMQNAVMAFLTIVAP